MSILYYLEKIRTPFFDQIMSYVTLLGSEIFLMLGALIVLWCIDKKWGYYLLFVSSLGTTINQFLKNFFAIPRPWIKDPTFKIVESARSGATGYSFPSGHTQTITSFLGGIARILKEWKYRFALIFVILLVAFSRMYLGVHTPLDVFVSLLIGTLLIFVLYPFFKDEHHELLLMIIGVALALGHVLFMEYKAAGVIVMDDNLIDGLKNAYTCLGLALSLPVIFYIDRKYLNYPTKAVWWAQIIKCVVGLALLLGVRTLLKEPLLTLTNGHNIADCLRYFLMAFVGGTLWPMTFKWFNKL